MLRRPGELTEAANDALQAQIKIAAVTWEKCIACDCRSLH
jgi:hypothetical protein